jgi:hypothetical protein
VNLREIDALVAEKVMGCKVKVYEYGHGEVLFCECGNGQHSTDEERHDDRRIPGDPYELMHFSSDIAAAWLVVEEVTNRIGSQYVAVQHCFVNDDDDWGWSVTLGDVQAQAATVPLAICLAALKAVGVEVPA